MYGDITKEYDECDALSQSRYILAKYRIQVDEKSETISKEPKESKDEATEKHMHIGPRALEPNLRGGDCGCKYESFCQFVWCLCVPCFMANSCWIHCCEMCYDECSEYVTNKEEVSRMGCCTMDCCKI